MKNLIITLLFVFMACSVYAQDFILSSPDTISEYENFSVKIKDGVSFKLEVSAACMNVLRVKDISISGGVYSTGDKPGSINFDNKCFEHQKVDIIFKFSGGSDGTLKYIVEPKREEKHDMGC